ncbi:MAG: neutral/alkaline non-lysosomal ceramidase N-terminal domain-containing protein [Oscillospiraceae bacterium]|nr:neutral/alkaline non-lysosomal ceramidase N-terminal domain-containing protein [Oscillospiraceae bacterium]
MENTYLPRTGFGREPIMPDTVLPLGGNGIVDRDYTGVNDTLYITCIAIRDEAGETALLYTMDTLKSEMFIHPLRAAVSEATGIAGERIFFSSTHTHNAPAVYQDGLEGVESYREIFRVSAVRAAQTALGELLPTSLSVGTAEAPGMAFSRHYTYAEDPVTGKKKAVGHRDEADCQAQLIKLTREGGKDILMMNFPVHGTAMSSEANKLISADVPGAIRAALEEETDLLVAYFIGAGGNQVPNSKAPDDHGLCVKDYGKKVAEFIIAALPAVQPVDAGPVKALWQDYAAPANKERIGEFDQATEVTKIYNEQGREAVKPYLKKYNLSSVWEAYAIRRRYNAADTVMLPLSVMKLGALSFVFAPYEMFAPNGQYIKENTPGAMTFVVSCANGAKGYLPMERAYKYGVYEGFVTLVKPGTAEQVAQHFIDMIKEA